MGPLTPEPHQLRTNKVFQWQKVLRCGLEIVQTSVDNFKALLLAMISMWPKPPSSRGGEECSTANCFNFGTPKKIVDQFFKSTTHSGTDKILAKNQKLIYWPPNN